MAIKYVAISNVIIDTVITTSGEVLREVLGGAGTYAAAGMRIWSEQVGIVSGVGEDFEDAFSQWFDEAGIDRQGLQSRVGLTPQGLQDYSGGEKRIETSQTGLDHFALMEPYPVDIPSTYWNARGIYVFRDDRLDFWGPLLALRVKYPFTLMWEFASNAAVPNHWEQVAHILNHVDLFSLNLDEGQSLLPGYNPDEIVVRLLSAGAKVVALRQGAQGSLVADQNKKFLIPPIITQPVDYTGAGNAFCGGFLAGFCEFEGNLAQAGICGSVSASFTLEQFGPPNINERLTQDARKRAATLRYSRR